jgi:hypothetical protein
LARLSSVTGVLLLFFSTSEGRVRSPAAWYLRKEHAMSALAVAIFLAVVVKTILDHIAEPLRLKFPNIDLWWFNYVALVLGGAVSWFSGLDLFGVYIGAPWLARLLTALVVGGGAKLINDVFSNVAVGTKTRGMIDEYDLPAGAPPRPKGW